MESDGEDTRSYPGSTVGWEDTVTRVMGPDFLFGEGPREYTRFDLVG